MNDPVDEAVLGIEGCSLDCGRPGVEGSGVEGIWEQVRVFLASFQSKGGLRWAGCKNLVLLYHFGD